MVGTRHATPTRPKWLYGYRDRHQAKTSNWNCRILIFTSGYFQRTQNLFYLTLTSLICFKHITLSYILTLPTVPMSKSYFMTLKSIAQLVDISLHFPIQKPSQILKPYVPRGSNILCTELVLDISYCLFYLFISYWHFLQIWPYNLGQPHGKYHGIIER